MRRLTPRMIRRRARRRREDGDHRSPGVRRAPVHSGPGPLTTASVRITPDDMEYARELGLGSSQDRAHRFERIEGALSVRVHPAFLYPGHPAGVGERALQRRHGRSRRRSPRSRCPAPAAGGPQTATAVLGDVVSAMIPPASPPEEMVELPIVSDIVSAFYLHLEVADEPGVLALVACRCSPHTVSRSSRSCRRE